MPINPTIALAAQAPAAPNLLQQFSQVEALRNMGLERQQHQQQLQGGRLELEQKQQDLRDQATFRQALADAGGNLEVALPTLAGKVNPQTWLKMQDSWVGMQKQKLALAESQGKVADQMRETVGKLALGVKKAGSTPQAFDAGLQLLTTLNPAAAQHLAPYVQRAQQDPSSIGAMMDSMIAGTQAGTEERKTAATEAQAAASNSRAASSAQQAQTAAGRLAAERPGMDVTAAAKVRQDAAARLGAATTAEQYAQTLDTLPHGVARLFPAAGQFDPKTTPAAVRALGMSPVEQAHVAQAAAQAARPVPGRDIPLPPEVERQKTRIARESRPVTQLTAPIPGVNMQPSQLTGQAYLDSLPPAFAASVRGIADGRDTIPAANSRSAAAQQTRNAVYQYDPTFSTQRAQVRRAFTTGKDGTTIGALNTAIVHLARLGATAEALDNGDFTPKNEMYNYFKDKFGSAVVSNFELLKDAVSGEMAAALKGTATDIEIANMKRSIRASNSPDQMKGVVREGMAILGDKATTYDERFHRENPDDPWSPILPSAQQALGRYGVQRSGGGPEASGGKVTVAVPGGKSYEFSSQAEADAFKHEAGIR